MDDAPTQLKTKDVPKLRMFLLKTQKGICPICRKEIKDACLDHSHVKRIKGSGLVRGLLDRSCNTFLGKIENNCMRSGIQQSDLPTILRSCADYLERKHLPYIHPSEKPKAKKLKKSSYNKLLKAYDGKAKFPDYPTSGKLTIKLEKLFADYSMNPEFYK